jgi:hypothetical protein
MESFDNQIDRIFEELGESPTGEDALRSEYLGHCNTTLLALAGHIILKYLRGNLSSENLKRLIAKRDSYADKIFERCEAAIKYEVKRTKTETEARDELFNMRNFFLRQASFSNIKDKLDSDIDLIGESEFYMRCGLE